MGRNTISHVNINWQYSFFLVLARLSDWIVAMLEYWFEGYSKTSRHQYLLNSFKFDTYSVDRFCWTAKLQKRKQTNSIFIKWWTHTKQLMGNRTKEDGTTMRCEFAYTYWHCKWKAAGHRSQQSRSPPSLQLSQQSWLTVRPGRRYSLTGLLGFLEGSSEVGGATNFKICC